MTELTSWEIHKFPIPTRGEFRLMLREGSRFLQVGLDTAHQPCVWFVEDMKAKACTPGFIALFTGDRIPKHCGEYMGSFTSDSDPHTPPLIVHLFTA